MSFVDEVTVVSVKFEFEDVDLLLCLDGGLSSGVVDDSSDGIVK